MHTLPIAAQKLVYADVKRKSLADSIAQLRDGIAVLGDFCIPFVDRMASEVLPELEAEHREVADLCDRLRAELGGVQ